MNPYQIMGGCQAAYNWARQYFYTPVRWRLTDSNLDTLATHPAIAARNGNGLSVKEVMGLPVEEVAEHPHLVAKTSGGREVLVTLEFPPELKAPDGKTALNYWVQFARLSRMVGEVGGYLFANTASGSRVPTEVMERKVEQIKEQLDLFLQRYAEESTACVFDMSRK